ncbi:MAG: hypothetical protein A2498_05755 [Lentisphaerae bacterium RIFOXYC12_FULL_60_16]|nr:MAG: hypothetical protein A2498_05755 [Lentisphaerae bacterium RIFOXYC12_FULL_60_16]
MNLNEQTLHIHNRIHRPLHAQPVTTGVPWPKGIFKDPGEIVAHDGTGRLIPAAFTVLNRWPDGSIQWMLADLPVTFDPSGNQAIRLAPVQGKNAPQPAHHITSRTESNVIEATNGLVNLRVSATPGPVVTRWQTGGQDLVQTDQFDITFQDAAGKSYSLCAGPRRITLEHANPCRTVIRVDGKHAAADGHALLDYYLRFELFAGRADIRVTHAFRNRETDIPGISIQTLQVHLPTTLPADATRCFTANNLTRHYLTRALRVKENPCIVASDTGDLEHYVTSHQANARADCFVSNPEVLHDPPETKPWFLRDPKFRLQAGGNKCVWPYLALLGSRGGALVSIEAMTSLHPKALTVDGSTFRLDLWPDWAGPLAITQGAGRSHAFRVGPLPAGISDEDMQTAYLSWEFGGVHTHVPSASTLEISPDLDHVRRCEVFAIHRLPAFEPDKHFLFERKIMDAWIGVSYGQLGAMDQVAPHTASGLWSFGDKGAGNNEEMHGLVYFQNYLRSGNWGCAEYGLNLARHIMEVDFVDYSTDTFQNGGQVSHCLNHNDGAAYPSHMWFTELLFAYVLTGDAEYRNTALRICENLLHWIEDPEGFDIISADQREAGQPLINLTWCYHFNPDARYLAGCRKIIDGLMDKSRRFGRMLDPKPIASPVKVCSYGDYASWEGMFWFWEITRDETVRAFMLKEFEWRITPAFSGVHGFHRSTDYNPAAYAYYLTGDRNWLERVAYPFQAAFRAAKWPIGWVHAMYYIKLAFDSGIVKDPDILVQ